MLTSQISLIYANIQKPVCNFVVLCRHVIHANFRQKPTKIEGKNNID